MERLVRFENQLEIILKNQEFISTDRYLELATKYDFLVYRKRDFLFHGGIWRGIRQPSLKDSWKSYLGKIVITGHADQTTSPYSSAFLKALGAISIFGTNTVPTSYFAYSQPTGICDDCDDSPLHRLIGNKSHFIKADSTAKHLDNYNNSIYVNFTTSNSQKARSAALQAVGSLGSRYIIKKHVPDFSEGGRINYLIGLRENSFVLCPQGNGIDTHRLWETLYMGGIPVILSNPILNPLIEDLPVVKLSDWGQLMDKTWMEAQWNEMRHRTWNFSKLQFSFWEERILERYYSSVSET
jgi:hypothetical protein